MCALAPDFFCGHVEAGSTAEIVAIHEGHGCVAQVGGLLDQVFRSETASRKLKAERVWKSTNIVVSGRWPVASSSRLATGHRPLTTVFQSYVPSTNHCCSVRTRR